MGRTKSSDRGSKKECRSTFEIVEQFLVVVVAHALFLESRARTAFASSSRISKRSAKLLIEDELQEFGDLQGNR